MAFIYLFNLILLNEKKKIILDVLMVVSDLGL